MRQLAADFVGTMAKTFAGRLAFGQGLQSIRLFFVLPANAANGQRHVEEEEARRNYLEQLSQQREVEAEVSQYSQVYLQQSNRTKCVADGHRSGNAIYSIVIHASNAHVTSPQTYGRLLAYVFPHSQNGARR